MGIKSAQEVIQEIEETRKEVGVVSIALDGAQVHFMIESMVGALQVVAELLVVSKTTDAKDWDSSFGPQEDSLKSAYELGTTAISSLKTFVSALPDNLMNFDKVITPEKLDIIASYFKEN